MEVATATLHHVAMHTEPTLFPRHDVIGEYAKYAS